MERRKFLSAGIGAILASSAGCIDIGNQQVNQELESPNPENNTSNTDDTAEDDSNDINQQNESSEDDPEPVVDDTFDAQVSLDNNGTDSWNLVAFNGAGGGKKTDKNPSLTLRAGTRYRFSNFAGSTVHPISIRSKNGNRLLSESGVGTFQDNPRVNVQNEDDYIEFTLTQELSDSIDSYACENHSSMKGSISIAR